MASRRQGNVSYSTGPAGFAYEGLNSKKCSFKISSYEKVRLGLLSSWNYQCQINSDLAKTHTLGNVSLKNSSSAGVVSRCEVTAADLDPIENKYLLVGRGNGSLSIYDASKYKTEQGEFGHIKTKKISNDPRKVKFSPSQINCVQWYPVDVGLFSSSCNRRPNCVRIWNPNILRIVEEFDISCRVYHHHMSPVASKHSLLAVAGDTGEIVLCDLRTGSSTHRVHGHEGTVSVVQWARHNPNYFASGGRDNTIRIWDVRSGRACLKVLNDPATSTSSRKKKKVNPLAPAGMITSLTFSYDGQWLISYGLDGALKVWNTQTYECRNINFGTGFSYRYTSLLRRHTPIAITQNLYPDLIYVPSRFRIFVYEITTGNFVNALEGHFDTVFGTIYNSLTGDLYSYGSDCKFLVWTPKRLHCAVFDDEEDAVNTSSANTTGASNCWSSDEN